MPIPRGKAPHPVKGGGALVIVVPEGSAENARVLRRSSFCVPFRAGQTGQNGADDDTVTAMVSAAVETPSVTDTLSEKLAELRPVQ